MSDPRILTPEQLAAIRQRASEPRYWNTSRMASRDIPALLASHAALTEQLDIAQRNAEQVAILTEKVADHEKLIHEYQDKDVQE
jgi:hypothetical protein